MPHFPYRAGNYILFAEIGSGTVGTTYIGRAAGFVRGALKPLVIRVLEAHLSQRPDVVRVFLDEQRSAALLQHPRIAALQEVGLMPDGNYFMAAEYVHGVPLREVLRNPQVPLTPAQAIHLAMQVCDALHYAHERLDVTGKPLRLLHGQLSPDAVMVGFDGNAKVTEFGLLRTRDAATATIPTLLQRRTAFMSPELRAQLPLRAAPQIDRRSDVYSIGALLWEMITGESLIPTEDGQPPPSPSVVRPVEPQLEAIVTRALSKSPADRFPTALSMRVALTSVASSIASDASVATGLARALAVAFRERVVAFQEQFDLWRKFEDDALPDSGEGGRYLTAPSGMGAAISGQRMYTPSSASARSQPSLSALRQTPLPTSTPPHLSPVQAQPPGRGARRLYLGLLLLAISAILVSGVLLILRQRPVSQEGAVLVDSQPRGAQILVEGRPAGNTPFRLSNLPTRTIHIEVRKPGFVPFSQDVEPRPGRTLQIDADLVPESR